MNIKLAVSVTLTVIAGILGFFVLANALDLTDIAYRMAFGASLMMAVGGVATTWFLLSTLSALTPATKRAYYIIAAGIGLYAFAQFEQLLIILLLTFFPDLPLNEYVTSGLFLTPYIGSALALYAGVHKLARLLAIKTWPALVAAGLTILTAVVAGFLVQVSGDTPSTVLLGRVILGTIAGSGVLLLTAAVIGWQIYRTIGTGYHRAMGWLVAAVSVLAVASLQEAIVKGSSLFETFYGANGLDLVPFVLAGLLFLKAGHALKQATFKVLPTNATYIDAVIYAAQLVSVPKAIDGVLERLRAVTSRLQSGAALTVKDKSEIIKIYRDIERYLITKEPLRKLTSEGLRSRLTSEFQQELATSQPD